MTTDSGELSPLQKANIVKNALFRENAIKKVATWREFVTTEAAAYRNYLDAKDAGLDDKAVDATRRAWLDTWDTAPTMPTKREYEKAGAALAEESDIPIYADLA